MPQVSWISPQGGSFQQKQNFHPGRGNSGHTVFSHVAQIVVLHAFRFSARNSSKRLPVRPLFSRLPPKREHQAHIMLAVLVAVDNPRSRQLYDELRAAYNFSLPSGNLQVPPFEEWRGMSAFCDKIMCRCVLFLATSMEAPTHRPYRQPHAQMSLISLVPVALNVG